MNISQQCRKPAIPSSDIGQVYNVPEDRETYLQYLHSQGINIDRLEESIKQLEVGEIETVKLDQLDDLLNDFIENANTKTRTKTLLNKILHTGSRQTTNDITKSKEYWNKSA